MKKNVVTLSFLIIISLFLTTNALAEEIFFTNSNNVSMTEEQYDYIGELFFDGYQNHITTSEFNGLLSKNLFNSPIEKDIYEVNDNLAKNLVETPAKKLTLSKSCGMTECLMVLTNAWKGQPTITSYDVIGALLYGNLHLNSSITTKLYHSGGTMYGADIKYDSSGWGVSMDLPDNSTTTMTITQYFYVYGLGTVFGSYQHALFNISLATSQLYNCNLGGYGGVFAFYGAALNKFDQMGGVSLGIDI